MIGGNSNSFQNTIQVVNFENVGNLQEAQSRQWSYMENLKNSIFRPAVVYSNEQLLVFGESTSETCSNVQFLDLASNTTGIHENAVNCGKMNVDLEYPGMYGVSGGEVSIFGGYWASESCIQQTVAGEKLDSEWECLSGSETSLDGLGFFTDGSSYLIRFSNFFV